MDELYDLAFAFRKSMVWKKLWDTEIFAVRHSDGTIGYCCVMGRLGKHLALAVYPGDAGLESCRRMSMNSDAMDMLERLELGTTQDCVMVSFQNKAVLPEESIEEIAGYCRQRGIVLRGAKAWPLFERFRPHHVPWFLTDSTDRQRMREGLEAVLEVAEKIKGSSPNNLGFAQGTPYGRDIPLLEKQGDSFTWRMMPLPPEATDVFPAMALPDELTLVRLKRLKNNRREWVCQLFQHMEPFADDPEDSKKPLSTLPAMQFPMMLMTVDNRSGIILGLEMAPDHDTYAQTLRKGFCDLLFRQGKPTRFIVLDARTQALLEPLSNELDIPLHLVANNSTLHDVLDSFTAEFSQPDESRVEKQALEVVALLEQLPDLHDISDDQMVTLLHLIELGLLSPKLARMVKQEVRRRGM